MSLLKRLVYRILLVSRDGSMSFFEHSEAPPEWYVPGGYPPPWVTLRDVDLCPYQRRVYRKLPHGKWEEQVEVDEGVPVRVYEEVCL